MRFVAHADAIVFDLRRNGGGNPEMVRFLCSYLFEKRVLLVKIHWREGDATDEYWTLREVPGPRLAEVPIFIVTSDDTFSAAEGFCDILQSRNRAEVVGAKTRGGANPGREFIVDGRFAMVIPTGRTINPVTSTNWEGVGIKPDVIVIGDDKALDAAIRLARIVAEARQKAHGGD